MKKLQKRADYEREIKEMGGTVENEEEKGTVKKKGLFLHSLLVRIKLPL